jgi:hypothetical protein
MAASVDALIHAGRRTLPLLHERLALIGARRGDAEARAIESAYRGSPTANFSHSVLRSCRTSSRYRRCRRSTGATGGTPDRVVETLRRARIEPGVAAPARHDRLTETASTY